MTASPIFVPDPNLDLVLVRDIDVPVELVWMAWTTPEHVVKWFTPAPWTVSHCEIDLRPGGVFSTLMRSPDGKEFPNVGCYLEIITNQKLVFTDALQPGFRPSATSFMTGVIALEARGTGTRYTATAIHHDAAARQRHEEMGFHKGWGTALDQLVAHIKSM